MSAVGWNENGEQGRGDPGSPEFLYYFQLHCVYTKVYR